MRWREREKNEKSNGGKGFRIEWGSIKGNKKGLCKKKQTCFACYQEGKNFIEPWSEEVSCNTGGAYLRV